MLIKSGFAINAKKTRMQYRDSRQEVTGLVVNSKVNVRREYRHTVRAMVHRLFTTGDFNFEYTIFGASGTKTTHKTLGKIEQLHGMLGFIDGVDRFDKKILPKGSDRSLTSKELMYRRFLLFKEFYAAAAPIIICEGKTDNVYITHAIRSLAATYPKLATIDSSGKISIKFRRFKYSGTSTGRILGITGGSGDLGNFMRMYAAEISRFTAPGIIHPVT